MASRLFVLLLVAAFPATDALRDTTEFVDDGTQYLRANASQSMSLDPVYQRGDKDCGPASVRNILRLSGEDVSSEDVYAEYKQEETYDGSTMTTIAENVDVLSNHGFSTHVCLNGFMALKWLVKNTDEAYIIWNVREPGQVCNHFVLSVQGQSSGVGNMCAGKGGSCGKKYAEISKWVYYDPWKEGAAEDEAVPPQTINDVPFGAALLDAYLQGHQFKPNQDANGELFPAIIAWKWKSRVSAAIKKSFPPCPATAYGKDFELAQKEGCARTKQTA